MIRSYADGVEATVGGEWRSLINPISWFKGKEYRDAVAGLRRIADQDEQKAETSMAHPALVPSAVELVKQRLVQAKLTVDDADPGFARSGQTSFWKTVEVGFAGKSTWTNNEASRVVNSGRWGSPAREPGVYALRACIPNAADQLGKQYTRAAHYRVAHIGATVDIVRNQRAANGWLDLGPYYFDGKSKEYVELTDQTDETAGTTILIFDCLQWVPILNAENAYNGGPAPGSLAYDIVVSGETAVLTFTVQNTGLMPWDASNVAIVGDAGNPKTARATVPLTGTILPGQTFTWLVSMPISGTTGVVMLSYRMQRSQESFGHPVPGTIIVLPPELRHLEQQLRQQIEDWKKRGQQAIEELLRQIQQAIQKELERQARTVLEKLCGGPSAMALFTIASVAAYTRQRKRRR